MNLSPAQAGFLKGLVLAVIAAVCMYLENSANLTGIVNPTLAVIIASVASAVESSMKASSGGTTALFGAVSLK